MWFKKGDVSADKIVTILLALVGGIIVIGVLFTVLGADESVFGNWICKTSVYLSDQSSGVLGDTLGVFLCETKYKKLQDSNKEIVLKKIAENMRRCWWMWGEGNLNPSPNWVKWGEDKCFVCYKMEIFEEVPKISLSQLTDYLEKTEIKGSGKTYWNYFSGLTRDNPVLFNLEDENNIFEKGEFYAITYLYTAKSTTGWNLLKVLTIGPYGLLAVTYDLINPEINGIMLSKYEDVKQKCAREIE